jgi:hypothetical protein
MSETFEFRSSKSDPLIINNIVIKAKITDWYASNEVTFPKKSNGDDEDEDDEDDEDDDESESETEYEYVSDNDYDSEKENYDEILHVHQLIIKELGDIYDTEEEEKKFKAFECWLPGVMLENYEYSSNGTEELWALYLVDQWYADPKDTGDEVDDDGNLLRHKRAKERRVDIIFDNRVVS